MTAVLEGIKVIDLTGESGAREVSIPWPRVARTTSAVASTSSTRGSAGSASMIVLRAVHAA